ncbi:Histidine kinase [Paenibacillus sp. yr247]|uniref:sensor histidine kinase n=1 Tax=Paenibacillus sp. yr247 TaxID=1761880 RepID=UPI00087E28C5|nr:histidine kinase [Paenibacillus sp. yr247]SDO23727.1 Histidine kinase [Paenibacillus sp. yr247]
MISYEWFTILVIIFILAPVIGAITLLWLLVFEREFALLKSQNTKLAMEKELHQMEYMQLNQQIQPHFLFNTLNLLLSLARLKKIDELVKSLEHLSLFFRFKYQIKEQLIPISKEVEYTRHYLEIQNLRFGQRLKTTVDCDEELKNALVLPYMLQTLVENSFKHGLEKKIGEALLDIKIISINEKVILEVRDNGPGESNKDFTQTTHSGQGLKNISRRLNLLFKDKATLSLTHLQGNGMQVIVSWPLIYQDDVDVKS